MMVPFLAVTTPGNVVTISCDAPPTVRKMRAIGDFNQWNAPGKPMKLSSDGLHWNLDLALEPGVYRYVLIEGLNTVPIGDEFKRKVQVLILPPLDFKKYPAIQGDGLITKSGILHTGAAPDVRRLNSFTYQLTLRTRKDDVESEAVAVWSEGGEQKTYPMHLAGSDPLFDYYIVKVVVNATRNFYYRFLLDDGLGARSYDQDGLSDGIIGGKTFKVGPDRFKIPPTSKI